MTGKRIIIIILFVFIILPAIITTGLQLTGAILMGSMVHQYMNIAAQVDKGPSNGLINVINARNDRGYKHSYTALNNLDGFTKSRIVKLHYYARIGEFLAPGEATPKPEDYNILALGRVLDVANKECEYMKKTFANKCKVDRASAKLIKIGSTNLLQVSARFFFSQKDGIGKINLGQAYTISELPVNLNGKKHYKELSLKSSESARQKYYKTIHSKCERMKRLNSICAIASVNIRSRMGKNHSKMKMSAAVVYSTLTKVKSKSK